MKEQNQPNFEKVLKNKIADSIEEETFKFKFNFKISE